MKKIWMSISLQNKAQENPKDSRVEYQILVYNYTHGKNIKGT
jgi:hypothetical protein